METEKIDNQPLESTAITPAFEESVKLSKERYVQPSNNKIIFYPKYLFEMPKVSIGALPGSSDSAKCSFKAGFVPLRDKPLYNLLTSSQLHALCSVHSKWKVAPKLPLCNLPNGSHVF